MSLPDPRRFPDPTKVTLAELHHWHALIDAADLWVWRYAETFDCSDGHIEQETQWEMVPRHELSHRQWAHVIGYAVEMDMERGIIPIPWNELEGRAIETAHGTSNLRCEPIGQFPGGKSCASAVTEDWRAMVQAIASPSSPESDALLKEAETCAFDHYARNHPEWTLDQIQHQAFLHRERMRKAIGMTLFE